MIQAAVNTDDNNASVFQAFYLFAYKKKNLSCILLYRHFKWWKASPVDAHYGSQSNSDGHNAGSATQWTLIAAYLSCSEHGARADIVHVYAHGTKPCSVTVSIKENSVANMRNENQQVDKQVDRHKGHKILICLVILLA